MRPTPHGRPRHLNLRALAALSALLLLVLALRPTTESRAATSDGLWVTTSEGLSLRDITDGDLIRRVPDTKGAHHLAVDTARGRIWMSMGDKPTRVRAYDPAGSLILELNLPDPKPAPAVADLAVETDDGTIAVAFSKSIRRYSLAGTLLGVWNATTTLAAVDYDPNHDTLWSVSGNTLYRFVDGAQQPNLKLPSGFKAAGLAVDPSDGSVWAYSKKGRILRVSSTGTLLGDLSGAAIRTLAADDNGAWVSYVKNRGLTHLNRALVADQTIAGALATVLAPDRSDDTLFRASGTRVYHHGGAEFSLSTGKSARDVAVFRSVAPPPTAAAGPDDTITLPANANLDGTVTPGSATVAWTKQSGPGTVTFGNASVVDTTASFSVDGVYVLRLTATANALSTHDDVQITVNPVPPTAAAGPDDTITLPASANLDGTVTPGSATVVWTKQSGPGTVTFGNASAVDTTASFSVDGVYVLRLTATANALSTHDDVQITVNPASQIPPDPSIVASEVTDTSVTDLKTATLFLYTGPNPIQTGVDPDDIERAAAAVVRGRVLERGGDPLPGVKVTIKGHTEFGQTLTRDDGMFDLAINAEWYLTVVYEKDGYITAQRTVQTFVQQYAFADDVVLVPYDSASTVVDLTAPGLKVALGSTVTDLDGTRRATLLFLDGTTANVVPPGGSASPISTLTLRVTEFTVGEDGPAAMPAALPSMSAYTYAVEVSADETGIDDRVEFSQPVIYLVENFLEWPVGWPVPNGSYDRTRAVWVPEVSGLVIKVVSETAGLADLDLNGDDIAEGQPALDALGVTVAERAEIASRYEPGQELWRVPLSHFTTLDMNGAVGPDDDIPEQDAAPTPDLNSEDCTICPGSQIELETQSLGEVIGLTGVPFGLHYDSRRMGDRRRTIDIDLTGAVVPPGTLRIVVDIYVAGQHHQRVYSALSALLSDTFTWDGKDGYGRRVYGQHDFVVRMDTIYEALYQQTTLFGSPGAAAGAAAPPRREGGHILKLFRGKLDAGWGPGGASVAGWTPSVHHVYDPQGRVLYLGTGERQSDADDLGKVARDVAGGGSVLPRLASNTPVGDLNLDGNLAPVSITSDPEGGYYFISEERLIHVNRYGLASLVAGGGANLSGPGLTTDLGGPRHLALGYDGKIYIGGIHRVQTYDPATGMVAHIAGTTGCDGGVSDPEGPALTRELCGLTLVAPAPDGSVYIAEENSTSTFDIYHAPRVIWRLGTDGIMRHVIPVSSCPMPSPIWSQGFCAFDVPASSTAFLNLNWLRVAPDGVLYIGAARAVARIRLDGILELVGNRGPFGSGTEDWQGKPYLDVNELNFPMFSPEGEMFLISSYRRIAAVNRAGIVRHVAARTYGDFTTADDGAPALEIALGAHTSYGFGFSPEGDVIFVSGHGPTRIRSIVSKLRGFGDFSEITIASRDGSEIYRFDGLGRHLATLHPLTGVSLWTFGYDPAGRLATLTDAFGNVTTIARTGAGDPISIIGPYGDTNTLTTDATGYLQTVTNPANETVALVHDPEGLLQTMTSPRGFTTTFGYVAPGRLASDVDAAGGSQTLSRAGLGETATRDYGWNVDRTTGLGRTTSSKVEVTKDGGRVITVTAPDGTDVVTTHATNGSVTSVGPDGATATATERPDPRFGIQAPLAGNITVTNPGGLTLTSTQTRTAVLFDPDQIFNIDTITDTVTVNGRVFTTTYDGTAKTVTSTSAEGRTSTLTIDSFGRPTASLVPGLAGSTATYDARGRLETVTTGAGVDARTTIFSYNSRGFLETVTDALGRTVTFEYDAAGRVTKQLLPGAREVLFTYDANGNLKTLTPPGKPAHTFVYNEIDQVTDYLPPDLGPSNEATSYVYNGDHQLDLEVRPDGLTIDMAYDSAGRLATMTFSRGVITFTYNPVTGLLSSISGPPEGSGSATQTVNYGYLGALQSSETWAGPINGSVSWGYDNNFRVVSQSVNGANAITYTYDDDDLLTAAGALTLTPLATNGLLTGATLDTITDTWAYNDFAETAQYTSADAGTTFYDVVYTRDKLGRITTKAETILGTLTTYDYAYDAAGRLETVETNNVVTATYTYDLNGNRLAGPGSETGTYDDQDRLLTYNGNTYTYDLAGDLVTKVNGADTTTYSYDELGNLLQVELPNGDDVNFLIDPTGRRIGRKVNGVLLQGWVYDGGLAIAGEMDGSGGLISRFVYATGVNVPDYVVQGGRTYRIITDHLGSLRFVVDAADGTVVQRMEHDEYGRVTDDWVDGSFVRVPFGFAGGLYDPLTGLVRFGARDYDAEIGRWTTVDPVISSTNAYEYAFNDPITFADYDGLKPTPYNLEREQQLLTATRDKARWARPKSQNLPAMRTSDWSGRIGATKGAPVTLQGKPKSLTTFRPVWRKNVPITAGRSACPTVATTGRLAALAPFAKKGLVIIGAGFFVKDLYDGKGVGTALYNLTPLPLAEQAYDNLKNPPSHAFVDTPPPNRW
ncbi:MAG: PKD domain-containing protein [Dehalococcoidia bacterium]